MLEEVLRYINNRFDEDRWGQPYGSEAGHFTIEEGTLELDGLKDGQYYWIEGSTFNDGLHQHQADDLTDEEFDGEVHYLVIPPAVIGIADEIQSWLDANADYLAGPYQSESFGGYSYTKASANTEGNEMPSTAWQVQFGARLRPYRKLSRRWV